ncbi:hypothetical protein KEM56_000181 [Ascosphaera pollenicola]|nr:hypothetical protein KEM56_000181 [Ascosphaera pollenicola]
MLARRRIALRITLGSRPLSWHSVRPRLLSQWAASSLASRPAASASPLRRSAHLDEHRSSNHCGVWNQQRRWESTAGIEDEKGFDDDDEIPFEPYRQKPPANTTPAALPVSCPGCGAFTQWVFPDEAGFYTLTRRSVKSYLKAHSPIEEQIAPQFETAQQGAENATPGSVASHSGPETIALHTAESRSVDQETESSSCSPLPEQNEAPAQKRDECVELQHEHTTTDTVAQKNAVQAISDSLEETKSSSRAELDEPSTNVAGQTLDMPSQEESSAQRTEESAPEGQLTKIDQSDIHDGPQSSVPSKNHALLRETPPHDSVEKVEVPVCDRCHYLKNHGVAPPIPCPPLSYVRDLLEESPYQYNHVYHVIDAADFPLSLISNIYRELDLQGQRSRNRRSKLSKYEGGHRKSVVSFIITRSDLLAATKEQVDHLMPYIMNLLRKELGIDGDRVRLGNVHMVSAQRGWWTTEVKEKIRDHAGGVWMVGKTNVGKSSLLSVVFPKEKPKAADNKRDAHPSDSDTPHIMPPDEVVIDQAGSLLPPSQPEAKYPVFPIVSAMPGTTALPIRIPLTHRKGEIIDLPGLSREGLEPYVADEWLNEIVMQKRVKAERLTIKSGQSLLIGGLIRITPLDPDLIVLAASFHNMPSHVTATPKAISLQTQEHTLPGVSIAKDGVDADIASAGVFELNDDVTRVYGQYDKFGNSLPYVVTATDILIEGCGWIEIIAQVRRKQLEAGFVPKLEIFSPKGQFVGSRPSMCAYSFELEKRQKTARKNKSRPRKSMRRVRLTSLGPLKKSS